MAIRSAGAAARAILVTQGARIAARMEGAVKTNSMMGRGTPRYFSDEKGRILSEEERAKETVYIQKMERERMEKIRRKEEKEKAEAEKKAKGGGEHQTA
ncbi:hypothetical protein ACMD2_20229 [Ananas comosus]|uniref:ATPase inhibitor n=1 Tax=Ananas comosus TaxID=4615 RepID=A0A199V9Q3_ANACO|nr:hypothetical protein ACMD2_20229 [Ananas comosus]